MKTYRCLGIDPGIAHTGLAVVERRLNYQLLASELVKSSADIPKAERLLKISKAVDALLDTHACELVAVERCYHNKNISSSQSTGAVIGVVMLAAAQRDIPVLELTPQQVKASSGLGGRCSKPQVAKMMSRFFKQRYPLNNHVADAAAAAIAGCLSI